MEIAILVMVGSLAVLLLLAEIASQVSPRPRHGRRSGGDGR